MNLRVIHLLRKVERIDRDVEDLDALLETLQMDREYSARLRDSLVEEAFRLRQLKQRINSQVIRVPEHFESLLSGTKPTATVTVAAAQIAEKVSMPIPSQKSESQAALSTAPKKAEAAAATPKPSETGSNQKPVSQPAKSDKKKPPFLFRFE